MAATGTTRITPLPKTLTPEERLSARQKQIDLGKATVGYRNYIAQRHLIKTIPRPKTPDPHRQCSKRAFDGLLRQWRQRLHRWDSVTSDDVLMKETVEPNPFSYASQTPADASGRAVRLGQTLLGRALVQAIDRCE